MSDPEEAEVAAWFEARAEASFETACARVFLTGDTAFKVKRRVALGYLDFTTAEARCEAIARELAFNKPAAPDIYRAVRRLTRSDDGGLELDGQGPMIEPVLEMRRFDETAVLSAQPQALDGDLAASLGRAVAEAHAGAPTRPAGRGLKYAIDSNAQLLRGLSAALGAEAASALIDATQAAYARHRPLLEARAAAGFARHCHGDLHLGNILLEDGRPVLFDCIEFSDILAEVDVLYDLAFLLMDLDFRDRRDAAVRALSAYLDQACRRFPEDHWAGLAALPLMLSVRAAVRAHASANGGDVELGRRYLHAALAHLSPAAPVLAAVGGCSGAGKSSFARAIAPELGPSPGAVILRTDEIRKRLAGAGSTDRLPESAYRPQMDEAVHAALFATAARLLACGRGVVLDATFLDPERRRDAEAVAAAAGATFEGVWLEAPAHVLAQRVAARRGDASDATVAVLNAQLAVDAGAIGWRRLDAGGAVVAAVEAWRRASPALPKVARVTSVGGKPGTPAPEDA